MEHPAADLLPDLFHKFMHIQESLSAMTEKKRQLEPMFNPVRSEIPNLQLLALAAEFSRGLVLKTLRIAVTKRASNNPLDCRGDLERVPVRSFAISASVLCRPTA